MPFLGKSPSDGNHNVLLDAITTSATATYNLTKDSVAYTPVSAQSLMVSLNGVTQAPIAAYTVSGSTIVFASALTSNDVIDYIICFEGPVKTVDASNIGAGTLSTSMLADDAITSAKIADDAITSALVADDAITSALIADDAITSALIADDAVVQAAIADDAVDEARLQISNAGSNGQFLSKQSGNTGGLTWATVSTTPSAGEIIETLMGQCDGRQVTVGSGTYTLTDVTGQQILSTSYADITGSSISYTPPSGTKFLLYRFGFKYDSTELVGLGHFEIQVDGNAVEPSRKSFAGGNAWEASAGEMYAVMEYVFNLNVGSTDTSEGEYNGWTGAKTIKVRGRDYTDTQGGRCHTNTYWDGGGASGVSAAPIKPMLYIQAIA